MLKGLTIGDITARVPIVQGGMGVAISLSGLAAAVANEGGIGVIATAGIGMDEPNLMSDFLEAHRQALRREIRTAREKTNGIIGVNIMVALTNYADMVAVSIEEGVDVIFSGAGMPINLPGYRKEGTKTKLVPIVSSGRAAAIICKRWIGKFGYVPDALVVEGPMAGGHLGFRIENIDDPAYKLEVILGDVLREVRVFEKECGKTIPVIAGGGVYTGKDMRRILELGAAGVQMATRFVTTHECDASQTFKDAYLAAKKEDLVIIKSPVGMPGRAIRNKFINDVARGERKPFKCPFHCIITCDVTNSPYCIALALGNAKLGYLDRGFAFSGANGYRNKEMVSVKQLMKTIIEEYEASAPAATA